MKYIVFDLEFTVLRTQKHLAETLEIGAIELLADQEGTLYMNDLFHSYVQPSRSIISRLTTEFTGITQEQADAAPRFEEAIDAFKTWLGDGEYHLCAWSKEDKYQLTGECRRHGMDVSWIRNYNDLQLAYTELKEPGSSSRQRRGLSKALEAENVSFLGSQHRAIDDAFNTAKLFRLLYPFVKLETNNAAEEAVYATEIVFSTETEERYNPFAGLAGLLQIS
ncbi:3'-5' exonuclease [Saccharibacillus qingshengii]|uniref:3'-5' exonuclease n=1 Tax=Saccharibacillus qingshengii TaxID=1763540 RepID=UPI00155561A5|nr:3'-5' exonuclease [Saccharibacillus qingshengii]